MRVMISSGHSRHVSGARGIIDEVTEARRVVDEVARLLPGAIVFHDDSSRTQRQNIQTIVAAHNRGTRDLDVSVHFNAFKPTDQPRGTETLYMTQHALAARVSRAIAESSGLIDRGAKKRTNLGFLRTNRPAILIEVCFVDSKADVEIYQAKFTEICEAIAKTISNRT